MRMLISQQELELMEYERQQNSLYERCHELDKQLYEKEAEILCLKDEVKSLQVSNGVATQQITTLMGELWKLKNPKQNVTPIK